MVLRDASASKNDGRGHLRKKGKIMIISKYPLLPHCNCSGEEEATSAKLRLKEKLNPEVKVLSREFF